MERQAVFWVAALAVVCLLLWLLGDVLLPFVAGFGLAYLLNPLANRLEKLGLRRWVAAILIVGGFALLMVSALVMIFPILFEQFSAFIHDSPGYFRRLQAWATDPGRSWLRRFVGGGFGTGESTAVSEIMSQATAWLGTVLGTIWARGRSLISLISLIVITPVVTFYFIKDWPRLISSIDSFVPLPHRPTVRMLARQIDGSISGFLRGQTTVCLALGAFYAIGLTLAGLKFGLLIGLVSGLISFIPFVGSFSGLLLSVGVAIAQFWPDWIPIVTVLGVFLVGQFLEGNVLQPKLVGESVGLHPVWIMFALLAFGYLFGFVGLLLAVPLAASIAVLMRFALHRYLESPLYTGGDVR